MLMGGYGVGYARLGNISLLPGITQQLQLLSRLTVIITVYKVLLISRLELSTP